VSWVRQGERVACREHLPPRLTVLNGLPSLLYFGSSRAQPLSPPSCGSDRWVLEGRDSSFSHDRKMKATVCLPALLPQLSSPLSLITTHFVLFLRSLTLFPQLSSITVMAKRKATAEDLLARAESNGYMFQLRCAIATKWLGPKLS
jgi:hypothetical protein